MHEWPDRTRRVLRDLITGLEHLPCRPYSRFRIVMNGAERLAPGHAVTCLLVQYEADRGVYAIFLLFPPSAQQHAGDSHLLALNGGYESLARAEDVGFLLCLRQAARIVHHSRVAALQLHHVAEFLQTAAGGNDFSRQLLAFFHARAAPRWNIHPHSSRQSRRKASGP